MKNSFPRGYHNYDCHLLSVILLEVLEGYTQARS